MSGWRFGRSKKRNISLFKQVSACWYAHARLCVCAEWSLPCAPASALLHFNLRLSPDDGLFLSPVFPDGFTTSFLACRRVSQVRLSDSWSDSLIRTSLHGCLDRGRGWERERERCHKAGRAGWSTPAGRALFRFTVSPPEAECCDRHNLF